MSAAKVLFTYKRKRLSSRSGVDHEDACADFSLDVQVAKDQDFLNETITSPENNLTIFERVNCNDADYSMNGCLESFDNEGRDFKVQNVCCGEKIEATHLSAVLDNSSTFSEKSNVRRSDTSNTRKMFVGSHEFSDDKNFKTSGENISAGASLGEITNSVKNNSCSLHSSSLEIERFMQGGSVSQSVEKDYNSLSRQSYSSKNEVEKGKLAAPLRTFVRRLKRKADAFSTVLCTELPHKEGDTTIKESDFGPVSSCTCDVAYKKSRIFEKSVDLKMKSIDADTNMFCQSCEKMIGSKIGDSSCSCRLLCAETPILSHTEVTSDSHEGLVVDASHVTKQSTNKTSGSVASTFDHPDAFGSTSLQKDEARCSSFDGNLVSSCNVACKKDEQPMSQQLGASSGDSQLTSSDSSDLKTGAAKRVEHRTAINYLDLSRPPPGAFVIDCNVIPESDVQEEASDVLDSLTTPHSEKVIQEGHVKSKSLELFGDLSVQTEVSPDSIHTSTMTETQPKTNYLQLFSDVKCGKFTALDIQSKVGHSNSRQNVEFNLHNQKLGLEQSSFKASTDLGLSMPMERIYDSQTSKDGPSMHQCQNPNVRVYDFNQNPAMPSFPDPASVRHKLLLESINTKASSLRGSRNISVDKFEPCPAVWSEEELDSLWIGIRRHGKGHWRAMLVDPKLRFAPWRVAGELEEQWEREQYKLFSGPAMPSNRYLKPHEAYKLHCHGPAACLGTNGRRENVAAETQLSLGDLYYQKAGVSFRSSAQSYGITQAQRNVTMASCSLGSYGCSSFNNVQASVMIRGEVSPDVPAMAFGTSNCIPHWFRDPISTPLRPLDLPPPPIPPPIPALEQKTGGVRLVHSFPEASVTSCKGKNIINPEHARVSTPSRIHYGNPSTRKQGMADKLIVIDSDASSEETISDDHNTRS